MIINHNMNALNAHRNMTSNTTAAGKSMEKLSSGLRINRAGDDAAGLAISEKMRGQIRGLDQASRNAQDGISMIQTAEGALNETHSIIQRMRELAVQAGNDTNTASDRAEIQKEINQLTSEVNRIGNTTEFNTQKLLNGEKDGSAAIAGKFELKGTLAAGTVTIDGEKLVIAGTNNNKLFEDLATKIAANVTLNGKYDVTNYTADSNKLTITQKDKKESSADIVSDIDVDVITAGKAEGKGISAKLQIGANASQSMTAEIYDMRAAALGITGKAGDGFTATNGVTDGTSDTASEAALDVSNHENASNAVEVFDKALNKVSAERSKLGAMQNRLEHTINNLGTSSENLTAAESRVRDVDMAKEMMTFSKNNILQQAAQAMLAQANQQPQGVLQLLR